MAILKAVPDIVTTTDLKRKEIVLSSVRAITEASSNLIVRTISSLSSYSSRAFIFPSRGKILYENSRDFQGNSPKSREIEHSILLRIFLLLFFCLFRRGLFLLHGFLLTIPEIAVLLRKLRPAGAAGHVRRRNLRRVSTRCSRTFANRHQSAAFETIPFHQFLKVYQI